MKLSKYYLLIIFGLLLIIIGSIAAIVTFNSEIRLIEIITNEDEGSIEITEMEGLRTLIVHADDVRSVSWSPDGSKLAAGMGGSTLRIWDTGNWSELHTDSEGNPNGYDIFSWSPDGSKLASASLFDRIKIWDTSDWTEFQIDPSSAMSLSWSPDGSKLAFGSERGIDEKIIKILNTSDWSELQTLTGYSGRILAVSWSPDGTKLASASRDTIDRSIKIWDTGNWTELQILPDSEMSVSWSPDSSKLASASIFDRIQIWDTGNWTELQNL
ncbi:MAG: WD40 repeat domain-containing protein, partial [Candidatus Kariarchaeaceae archaeon]